MFPTDAVKDIERARLVSQIAEHGWRVQRDKIGEMGRDQTT